MFTFTLPTLSSFVVYEKVEFPELIFSHSHSLSEKWKWKSTKSRKTNSSWRTWRNHFLCIKNKHTLLRIYTEVVVKIIMIQDELLSPSLCCLGREEKEKQRYVALHFSAIIVLISIHVIRYTDSPSCKHNYPFTRNELFPSVETKLLLTVPSSLAVMACRVYM